MASQLGLLAVTIRGYRPFRDFRADFGPLEVLVGANGAGKSSLFEFLRFLRDSTYQEIPPEIVSGSIGQMIFHVPGPERFSWSLEIDTDRPVSVLYEGEVMGPIGRSHVAWETLRSSKPFGPEHHQPYVFMDVRDRQGVVQDPESGKLKRQEIALARSNQLALSTMTNPSLGMLYNVREYVRGWRFYSSFNIANEKIRKSVPIEQEPVLYEDAGNLSSVLHYLMTEHGVAFDQLQQQLRLAVPGFDRLSVKARGGPGEVIAFWREKGSEYDFSLADLSDGILRLICWMALCVHPNPPPLICIDEPDQGVHPRTLPILAGLFSKASERTQIVLATHASYFLVQFDISQIAVIRKDDGAAEFIRPSSSAILRETLEDFGTDEIELLHRSDELERLP